MGSCLSKKGTNSSTPCPLPDPKLSVQISSKIEPEKPKTEEEAPKKEIFIIRHRKSNDRRSDEEKPAVQKVTGVAESGNSTVSSNLTNCGSENSGVMVVAAPVRTSSCTKEEVDAILIQCGRLSRSSSMGKAAISGDGAGTPQRGKKYSGSKRSYDFDNEGRENCYDDNVVDGDDDDVAAAERIHRHRQRHRQGRAVGSSSPHSRRRTPSRERDQQQQQRSNSRERINGAGGGGGGRRVSRSPGRRSESPITSTASGSAAPPANNSTSRPGKMVSVPATVSSMAMDKSNNGVAGSGSECFPAGGVKRIQVKRNAGEPAIGSRTAASPRSRSPARTNLNKSSNENQPLSLSRSNSRKAEHSPYRRNPLSDIDNNVVAGFEQTAPSTNKGQMKKPNAMVEETNKEQQPGNAEVVVGPTGTGTENSKPQTLTRTRSARKSRDLDINPESLLNPTPSYTALLLEDIQNFHDKNNNTPSFSLPPCLTKACSILEAVADLNSTTSSNLSSAFTDDRRRNLTATEENSSTRGKKRVESKDPIMESEVIGNDDLMQPSFHKYVTVRRGPPDMEEQESSGSNSYVGGPHQWLSSSWEPNSADSTDCFTSSRSNLKDDEPSQVGVQRKRESGNQQNGIGRGRVGIGRVYMMPGTAAAST